MGIWNDRKLIVNCLPLTESERAQFIRAAKDMPQEFVGDSTQRGSMSWTAAVPEELKAKATAVIGNIAPEECAQCPKLEWLQTWSAGVDKYQQPGILHPGSMLTNATGAYGQSVSEHMFAMMWAIMKNLHIYAASNPNAMWQDAGRAIPIHRRIVSCPSASPSTVTVALVVKCCAPSTKTICAMNSKCMVSAMGCLQQAVNGKQ